MAKVKEKQRGFYKLVNNKLAYEPVYVLEFVNGIVQKLFAINKDSYKYPTYGWYWFDSEEEANKFFSKED